jgi:benzoyl-CoA-dihydrodiol lyase
MLRTNDLDIGIWVLKTKGHADHVLATDALLTIHQQHWFVREVTGMLRRTLARLDVTSRTLIALVEADTCFAGTLAELLLTADRSYMLTLPDAPEKEPGITLSPMNFGSYPMVNGLSRIAARFYEEAAPLAAATATIGRRLNAADALTLGLVTATPDDLDWDDEIRLVLEERASLSPDALTGLEANLRFGVGESMETRVFGRLSAWQNWIFIRPNATGEAGALKVFGTGNKAKFNWERV